MSLAVPVFKTIHSLVVAATTKAIPACPSDDLISRTIVIGYLGDIT